MAEETRVFLRTALYAAIVGAIYWFVSYEWVGTFLFAFVVIGGAFFAIAISILIKESRSEIVPETDDSRARRIGGAVYRTLGFEEHPGDPAAGPLTIEEEPIPPASAWPLVLAVAATLLGLGLLYGMWFWLPGALLAVTAAWGWMSELY